VDHLPRPWPVPANVGGVTKFANPGATNGKAACKPGPEHVPTVVELRRRPSADDQTVTSSRTSFAVGLGKV
jgi:hypothetical protein